MIDQFNDIYRKGNNWKKKLIEEILIGKIMKKYGLGIMVKKCMGVFSRKYKILERIKGEVRSKKVI